MVQLQANPSDDQAWKRLKFCTLALDRAKISAPVLDDPLGTLASQVAGLNKDIDGSNTPNAEIGVAGPRENGSESAHHDFDINFMDETQWRELVDLGFPEIEVDPNIFDILPNMEPISANLGALGTFQ